MYSRVEPRYNNVSGDWQNLFTITRFCDIEVLFHMFYYYWAWGKENHLLYWGLCYIEVRYIEVPQLYVMYDSHLLIAMHSKGHQHLPPPPLPPPSKRPIQVLSLTLSEEVRLAFLILNRVSINFVMFPGMGYNINFEHTRVTILTEKQVFLEQGIIKFEMQNPFLYK